MELIQLQAILSVDELMFQRIDRLFELSHLSAV